MTTTPRNTPETPADANDAARPDFLQMDGGGNGSNDHGADGSSWYGWPHRKIEPVTLLRPDGKTERVRTPVMELEGLITPTELHYVVQHFGVPDPVPAAEWSLAVDGEVKKPLRLSYEEVRRFPARSVRTVMECSGSDATYFEYFKGEGPRPSRTQERMILSGSEWTGVPLAAVLNAAGLTGRATHVRAEGWDEGVPATAEPGTEPFFYDKGLPLQKALHPDTILAYAQNGQALEHLHGAPIRLLAPGWRSPLYRTNSSVPRDYYGAGRQVCFFYLNAGTEIGRVEMPSWVAEDETLRPLTHALIWDQCQRGQGYPAALSEAHEQAVIKGADRRAFRRMLAEALQRQGLPPTTSEKDRAKRHPWL